LPPLRPNDGATRGPEYKDDPNHEADTLTSQPPPCSILEKIASIPRQSFPETWQPTIGTPVTVYTGGDAQLWKVHHIRQGIGTSITLKHENSKMIVDMSWLMFDINIGSLVLQRLGFFSDTALKRTTNSIEIWRNILNPDKMIDGETLTVLLEWTIHGSPSNDKLGLPEAQSKTWLVDRSFWQSWEQNNDPQPVPWVKCKEWVCIEREPIWGTEVTHNRLCKLLDICFSTCMQNIDPKDGGMVTRCALPDQERPNTDLDRAQFMTCDYIKGTKGHYMPRESFLQLRKYERMIEKITPPTPIHLLDHIIIPINIRKSHWFPAHINLQAQSISLLDSSQVYSAASYPQQKMLIWKFFRMVWTTHVSVVAPGPYWTMTPERFIGLHPRLTDLKPVMLQTLRNRKQVTIRSIMDATNDHIKTRWNRRGMRPEPAGTQSTDPSGQNWTELERPGTPQQKNLTNTKETRLACGIYTVLSALHAVQNWKIDFVLQAHISQARNWMAAIGHVINEVVSLHRNEDCFIIAQKEIM